MRVALCILLLTLLFSPPLHAEPELADVYRPAEDGFASIRIPSVVVSTKGTVLAFAEGRAANADQARNKIVLKRSADGGRTWSNLRVLADDGDNSLNNPCAVVERESGRILLMYQRIPAHLKEASGEVATGYEGANVYRNLLIESADDGASWTKPLDITRTTKRPTGATTCCSGPGIGIQLTRGEHKGRLVIPFNEGPFWKWCNFAVFSDDQGKNWAFGENAPGAMIGARSQVNEVQVVELSDGSVRLNSRQFAGEKVRKTAVSHDGGATWSAIENVPELKDPSCMASIFRYSFDDAVARSRILYSGPDSNRRSNGTICLSYDEGKTWPIKRVLEPGSFGYSVLTKLADGKIGCLFETNGKMVFARFAVDWLGNDR